MQVLWDLALTQADLGSHPEFDFGSGFTFEPQFSFLNRRHIEGCPCVSQVRLSNAAITKHPATTKV